MYLQPEQALGLIAECAKRFPGGQMLFDFPPALVLEADPLGALRPSLRYRVPPMPFSLSAAQAADLVHTVPGIRAVRDLLPPPGRGRCSTPRCRSSTAHRSSIRCVRADAAGVRLTGSSSGTLVR